MQQPQAHADGLAFLERLSQAIASHDIEKLVACFHPDYRNETPAHPDRGFVGDDQVRRNWTQIFAAVPNLEQHVLRAAVDGSTVWAELEHTGNRPDGTEHVMAGVAIFGIRDGRAQWVRFYLEPRTFGVGPDAAVQEVLRPGAPS